MARTTDHLVPDDVPELADLLRPAWADISAGIPQWHPRLEGEGDGGDAAAGADDDAGAAAGADDVEDDAGAGAGGETDWKAEARKHERRAKANDKARKDLEAKLAEIEGQNKTESEKAIEKARAEAKAEALAESDKERRQDRLEVASTRIASTGVKVKDDDGKDVVLRFADPDDAHVYLERAIRNGDVDPDDIFNAEGKVQTDALSAALEEILVSKPHLQANANGSTGSARVSGSADAGKGSGASTDEESLTPQERLERLQQSKK